MLLWPVFFTIKYLGNQTSNMKFKNVTNTLLPKLLRQENMSYLTNFVSNKSPGPAIWRKRNSLTSSSSTYVWWTATKEGGFVYGFSSQSAMRYSYKSLAFNNCSSCQGIRRFYITVPGSMQGGCLLKLLFTPLTSEVSCSLLCAQSFYCQITPYWFHWRKRMSKWVRRVGKNAH